jgi:hypothetical protein
VANHYRGEVSSSVTKGTGYLQKTDYGRKKKRKKTPKGKHEHQLSVSFLLKECCKEA